MTEPISRPERLFLPYLLDIGDQVIALKQNIPYGNDIDVGVIVKELFDNIFYDKVNRYGMYSGALGAYKVMIPEQLSEKALFEVDV